MEKCIADKIIEARLAGVAAGQEKYRTYFVKGINAKLYKNYRAKVDAVLTANGCADCIVTE